MNIIGACAAAKNKNHDDDNQLQRDCYNSDDVVAGANGRGYTSLLVSDGDDNDDGSKGLEKNCVVATMGISPDLLDVEIAETDLITSLESGGGGEVRQGQQRRRQQRIQRHRVLGSIGGGVGDVGDNGRGTNNNNNNRSTSNSTSRLQLLHPSPPPPPAAVVAQRPPPSPRILAAKQLASSKSSSSSSSSPRSVGQRQTTTLPSFENQQQQQQQQQDHGGGGGGGDRGYSQHHHHHQRQYSSTGVSESIYRMFMRGGNNSSSSSSNVFVVDDESNNNSSSGTNDLISRLLPNGSGTSDEGFMVNEMDAGDEVEEKKETTSPRARDDKGGDSAVRGRQQQQQHEQQHHHHPLLSKPRILRHAKGAVMLGTPPTPRGAFGGGGSKTGSTVVHSASTSPNVLARARGSGGGIDNINAPILDVRQQQHHQRSPAATAGSRNTAGTGTSNSTNRKPHRRKVSLAHEAYESLRDLGGISDELESVEDKRERKAFHDRRSGSTAAVVSAMAMTKTATTKASTSTSTTPMASTTAPTTSNEGSSVINSSSYASPRHTKFALKRVEDTSLLEEDEPLFGATIEQQEEDKMVDDEPPPPLPLGGSTGRQVPPTVHSMSKLDADMAGVGGERQPLLHHQQQHQSSKSHLRQHQHRRGLHGGSMSRFNSIMYNVNNNNSTVAYNEEELTTIQSIDNDRDNGDDVVVFHGGVGDGASDNNIPPFVTTTDARARYVDSKRMASNRDNNNKTRLCCTCKALKDLFLCCISVLMDPFYILDVCYKYIICSYTVLIAFPMLVISYILYHSLGNPSLDFLPGTQHISTWFDFMGRQIITYEISQFITWLIVDCYVLSTSTDNQLRKKSLQMLGSFMILLIMESKGWPCTLLTWGIVDLIVLHGDNEFQTGWLLYFTRTEWNNSIYDNRDDVNDISRIINSDFYLKLLISMIIAGTTIALKRAFLTIYFGQRQLAQFKQSFSKLLRDAILLGEIATGAEELAESLELDMETTEQQRTPSTTAHAMANTTNALFGSALTGSAHTAATASTAPATIDEQNDNNDNTSTSTGSNLTSSIQLSGGGRRIGSSLDGGGGKVGKSGGGGTAKKDRGLAREWSTDIFGRDISEDDDDDEASVQSGEHESGLQQQQPKNRQQQQKKNHMITNNSDPITTSDIASSNLTNETTRLMNLLDSWEEPLDKSDKTSPTTLEDVLKFDRALDYMEETQYPFGEDFGLAANRSECIESADAVYDRLLILEPNKDMLTFDTLRFVVEQGSDDESDSQIDEIKMKALRRRFPPDANENISRLDFIQTCDGVYKRLRYFRASVNNASAIDKVLEDMINAMFYFALLLLLSSVMKVNAYAMVVSVGSLLVSVSFALGSSVSKFVEGLLLIAVRRPYDLGDRIVISNVTSHDDDPGPSETWFVEDINLFSTKLRYAKTNQVSTVMNWSIISSRIVNYNRSPNALVYTELRTSTAILADNKIKRFRRALDDYIKKNTKIWDCITIFRTDLYNADIQEVLIALSFRHRSGWQDAGRIMIHRADLLRYIHETGVEMGVHFETAPGCRIYYQGGELEEGHADDYKKDYARRKHFIKQKQN